MQMMLVFQHYAKGASRPDDITLSHVPTPIESEAAVPSVGDIITMQVCWPDEKRGQVGWFKVIGRTYAYTREVLDNGGIGKITDCWIYVFVTPGTGDEIGMDVKQ